MLIYFQFKRINLTCIFYVRFNFDVGPLLKAHIRQPCRKKKNNDEKICGALKAPIGKTPP